MCADNDRERFLCQNCEKVCTKDELEPLEERGIFERVSPGEPMPAGACPECGALCHSLAALRLNEDVQDILADITDTEECTCDGTEVGPCTLCASVSALQRIQTRAAVTDW